MTEPTISEALNTIADAPDDQLRALILAFYRDDDMLYGAQTEWFWFHLGMCTSARLQDCVELIRLRLDERGVPLANTAWASSAASQRTPS